MFAWEMNQSSRGQAVAERLRPTTEPPCRRDLSSSTAHVERPLLSAIIQTFNDHKRGQPQQLVLRLKLMPMPIEIIVNDDSRNGPAEWLPMLTGPNDFYVASPNVHELRAYDRLARMARGEFLVLLQGDFCLPSTAAWMLDAMMLFRQLPMLGLLGGNLGFREEIKHGQTPAEQREIGWGRSKYKPIRHLHNATPFQWVHGVNIGPLFVRRDTFHVVGGFDESFSCPGEPGIGLDVELSLRVWELGKGVGVYYSGVSNGLYGRKTQHAPARRRNEVLNQARCEPLWRRLNASVSSRVMTANAQLTQLSETRAGELRTTLLRKGIYGPGVTSHCAVMDPRWMAALQGRSSRVGCTNMTNFSAPDATRQGNDWQLCLDDWEPAQSCLAFSVGIGNAWQFDDALATQLGCEVHSFDPTQELLAAHKAHHVPGVQFHYVGLGRMQANAYGQKGRDAQMMHLPEMMRRWAGKRTIDVLKLDCEGCEWGVLNLLAFEYPSLLRRVRLLLVELHVSTVLQMRKGRELRVLMNHVFRDHGFRTYRHRTNLGKVRDRMRVLPELAEAGLDPEPCCYELHLMRENATDVPNSDPWSIDVPKPASEPSLASIRARDLQVLATYDRNHGTHHVERMQRLRAKVKSGSSGSRRLSSEAGDSESDEQAEERATEASTTPRRLRQADHGRVRSVLVVGASRGIGLAAATLWARRNVTVHATYRGKAPPSALVALASHGARVHLHALDVLDPQQLSAVVDQLSQDIEGLDVLLYSAGVNQGNASVQHAVNAEAPFAVLNAVLPALLRGSRRVLGLLTSSAGTSSWLANRVIGTRLEIYGRSKLAANAQFRKFEPTWRARGVTAVALHPGHVATDMNDGVGRIGVEESALGLLSVLEALSPRAAGSFVDWQGSLLAWDTGKAVRGGLRQIVPAALASSADTWRVLEGPTSAALLAQCADPVSALASGEVAAIVLRGQLNDAAVRSISEQLLSPGLAPHWTSANRSHRSVSFASLGSRLNHHLSNPSRRDYSKGPADFAESASRYEAMFGAHGLHAPVEALHGALREVAAGRRFATGRDMTSNRSFAGGVFRRNFNGGSFPLHFDSLRHSSRFYTDRKCNERRRTPSSARRLAAQHFPDMHRFDTQFSALLLLQRPEGEGEGEVTVFDAHWSELLHDCSFTAKPTVYNVHVDHYEPSFLSRWRRATIDVRPGDVYLFNSNRLHMVGQVHSEKHRLSLGSFVGVSAQDMRVWS